MSIPISTYLNLARLSDKYRTSSPELKFADEVAHTEKKNQNPVTEGVINTQKNYYRVKFRDWAMEQLHLSESEATKVANDLLKKFESQINKVLTKGGTIGQISHLKETFFEETRDVIVDDQLVPFVQKAIEEEKKAGVAQERGSLTLKMKEAKGNSLKEKIQNSLQQEGFLKGIQQAEKQFRI